MAIINGTAGNDVINGTSGVDIINGLGGNDWIWGHAGADIINGGAGDDDRISYTASNAAVTVNLATGASSGGHAQGDIFLNVEGVIGSAFDDTLTGDNGGNQLWGHTGNDTLNGGNGNDALLGDLGVDRLDGGAGSDTARYDFSAVAVSVNLATGAASGGEAAGDILISIENLRGSAHDDVLAGDAGVNLLEGLAGNDSLQGGAGADHMVGGDGSDFLEYISSAAGISINLATGAASGGDAQGDTFATVENVAATSFDDTVTGDAGANILRGAGGNDILDGGAGDDLLQSGTGADRLIGGIGSDWIDHHFSGLAVSVNLATGASSGGDAEGDTFTGIENVMGSAHDDALTGDAGANQLLGLDGNDRLEGGAGADRLDGGAGSFDIAQYAGSAAAVAVDLLAGTPGGGDATGDVLTGIEGLVGSAYNDQLFGNDASNGLDGGAGDDLLRGRAGADLLLGRDGADILDGGADDDGLFGDAGDDSLSGGAGADDLDGGDGIDLASYEFSSAAVTIDLANGSASGGDAAGDTLVNIEGLRGSAYDDSLVGGAGASLLEGLAGNDRIIGMQGDDVIDGGAGDDELHGSWGADTLRGGDGIDIIAYLNSDAAVTVNLATGAATGGYAEGDSWTGIEGISGSQLNDTLTGDAAANTLLGLEGDDRLEGGAGADMLDGGAGAEDMALYTGSAAAVVIDLLAGTAGGGDAAGDTLAGIEGLTGSAHDDRLAGDNLSNGLFGGAGDDIQHGRGSSDVLLGGDGADTLDGGADNDGLFGEAGDDALHGGAGGDRIDGGDGTEDTAFYDDSAAAVSINLATGSGAGGDAAGDFLVGVENVYGSNFNDTLVGDAGANFLIGLGGNDVLRGSAGDDDLHGGAGADQLLGGDGIDLISYELSSAAVTINLATGAASGGDAAGDTFAGIEIVWGGDFGDTLTGDAGDNELDGFAGDDVLRGGDGADGLTGGDGADRLVGGAGDDRLLGGAGADTLYGQAGADRFIYAAAGDTGIGAARDVVADFSSAEGDRIDLGAIDADGDAGNGDTAFTFIGAAAFTGQAGQLRVVGSGQVTVASADIDGDGQADLSIAVLNVPVLTAADFVL